MTITLAHNHFSAADDDDLISEVVESSASTPWQQPGHHTITWDLMLRSDSTSRPFRYARVRGAGDWGLSPPLESRIMQVKDGACTPLLVRDGGEGV